MFFNISIPGSSSKVYCTVILVNPVIDTPEKLVMKSILSWFLYGCLSFERKMQNKGQFRPCDYTSEVTVQGGCLHNKQTNKQIPNKT